jgi:Mg/Co/Ni transporter MgtE
MAIKKIKYENDRKPKEINKYIVINKENKFVGFITPIYEYSHTIEPNETTKIKVTTDVYKVNKEKTKEKLREWLITKKYYIL